MAREPTDAAVTLSREERERIDGMFIKLANANYYEVLGVRPDADRKTIRDAFFAMSRQFHPDAYYGQSLGAWKARIEQIFRELSRAYDVLGNPRQRAEYDAFLSAQELTTQVSPAMLPPVPWIGETPSELPPAPAAKATATAPAGASASVAAPPPRDAVTLSPPRVPVLSDAPPTARKTPTPPTAIARPAVVAPPPVSRAVPPGAEAPARPSLTVPVTRPGGEPGGSIQIDAEAAQRAAREALARKLRGGRPSSGALPAQRPSSVGTPRIATTPPREPVSPTPRPSTPPVRITPAPPASSPPMRAPTPPPAPRTVSAPPMGGPSTTPPPPASNPPRIPSSPAAVVTRPPFAPSSAPPVDAPGGYSSLQSLQATRAAQADAQRQARVRALLQTAEEAIGLKDLIAASDALTAARTLAPDDAAVRARADEVARLLAASLADKFIEQARFEERSGNWYDAAQSWQKAWLGRNQDFMLLVRAAHALLRADKELPRAADMARRAVMMAPSNLDAHIVLARIFIAGRLRESAIATLEAAAKIDPNSQVVKDLQKRVRGG